MNNDKIKEMIAVQQEIIPVEQGRLGLMVDARLLHENLKINTRFNDWIQRRIEEYGFIENEDFEGFYSNLSKTPTGWWLSLPKPSL